MNFVTIDILGWSGFLLILLGYYLNAKKKLFCFVIWGFGNIIYICYGYIINALPLMAMSFFILLMNIFGYLNWIKK
tara:strand:+ start:353 stop:580 length:228 start_codon:yes stop_codon:yes gene_type:complete